jgi:hypothetical protein
MSDPVTERLFRELDSRAEALCRYLKVPGQRRGQKYIGLKTSQDGPGDSFAVELTGPRAGRWNHATRGGLHAFSLIKWWLQIGDREAFAEARKFLGGEFESSAAPAAPIGAVDDADEKARREKLLQLALGFWRQTRAAPSTPAETYWRVARGIPGAIPADIRYHPGLRHPETGFALHPCLVAGVRNVAGEIVGIWRVYLRPGGRGKAPLEVPRLGLGSIRGGAVWLRNGPAEQARGRLYTGEGIETMGTVAARFPKVAACAALSTSGLVGLELPPWVTEGLTFADFDERDMRRELVFRDRATGEERRIRNPNFGKRPGIVAAERSAARFRTLGKKWGNVLPGSGEGTDFNDLWHSEAGAA